MGKKMIEVMVNGKPLITPAKNTLAVPTQALADAIIAEQPKTQNPKPTTLAQRPLTSIAYTAIDRIAGEESTIIEVLLVYLDTDTLSYRASGSEALVKKQKEQWDPVLARLNQTLGVTWQITSGVMPIDQPPELHKAVEKYLLSLNAMQLSAVSILSSSLSSLALAVAVLERHITAEEAFRLSRLEEDHQAEQWGRDDEVETRALRLKAEISDGARFLDLLSTP